MSKKKDYYTVLEIARTSSATEIKAAYRKAAMKFHPDRNPGNQEAEENFKAASEAYEVLSDDQKRKIYDTYGHEGLSGQGYSGFRDASDIFSAFGSIFEDFFGFSGGGGGRSRTRKGADLRYDLELSFEEAVFGVEKEIEFERNSPCKPCSGSGADPKSGRSQCRDCGGAGQVRQNQGFFSVAVTCPRCRGEGSIIKDPCKTCRGQGNIAEHKKLTVKVPPGVDSGLRLRVTGEGEGGRNSSPAGDLYVFLSVADSDRFIREGVDLLMKQPLTITQATLGCKLNVQTLDSEKPITVNPGTQHGERLTIPQAGVPHLKGVDRGDLYIEFEVRIPKKLNKEQRELLERFAEISAEEPPKPGFFQRIFE